MEVINETVLSFNSEYNLGKETAKSLMHFCRPSVEKYIFAKVHIFYSLNVKFSFTISCLQCMRLRTKMKTNFSKIEADF